MKGGGDGGVERATAGGATGVEATGVEATEEVETG